MTAAVLACCRNWNVEIPNTQWALYPMGGGISAGGAVITAWFLPPPLLQLTLMPVTERYLSIGRLLIGCVHRHFVCEI